MSCSYSANGCMGTWIPINKDLDVDAYITENNVQGKVEQAIRSRCIEECEKIILRLCEEMGITCKFSQCMIFIRTQAAYWRIAHDNYKVISVFHENYRTKKTTHNRPGGVKVRRDFHGFHTQIIPSNKLVDVIRYIYLHDRNYLS